MTQTYRTDDMARWGTGQGFNLTPAQVDVNFWDLIQRVLVLEALPDAAAGIDHFEIVGVNMFVHMTDDSVLGPYELPVATFNDRGVWTPSTVYSVMDTFSINGGLYVVIFDHTSELTFDAGANDGLGHDYYQLMIQTPGSALPAGGAVGQLLVKTTVTDYAVGWGYTDASVVGFEPATGSTLTADNVADALEEMASGSFSGDAVDVVYDPTDSGLTAINVQDAIDELAAADAASLGRQTIWIPAGAMTPRTSNGAEVGTVEMTTNKNMVKTLDFDASSAEYAQFDVAMPKSWDLGTVFFKAFWSHAATTTNFGIAFSFDAVAVSNGDALDVAFGTAVTVTDTGGTTNTQYVTAETAAVTVAGTPAAGDALMVRLSRDPANGSDNMAIDARLHGVQMYYTTSAATDD